MKRIICFVIILTSILSFQGCGETKSFISLFFCQLFNSKSDCLKKQFIEIGKHTKLESGQLIKGDSGLFKIKVPSDKWLLNGWGGKDSGNKDIGIIHESGSSYLDVEIESLESVDADNLSEKAKKDIADVIVGFCDKTGVENKTLKHINEKIQINSDVEGYLVRSCLAPKESKYICFYKLIIPYKGKIINLVGLSSSIGTHMIEFEEMLTSVKLY